MATRRVTVEVVGRDKASPAFNRAGRSATSAGDRIKRFGAFLGRAAMTTAAGVGVIAAAGVALGVKTAASNEQAMISFETLLGSGKKAKKFYSDLKTFAAATPFEMPGLVDAARQLIGVGESAKRVIPIMTAWGDTAGALGLSEDQFARAMLARNQAMAKGKLQAEELMQITEAGIPVYGMLSRAMGKPVSKIQEMSSKGELLSKKVLPLLEKQMNKEYGGAMAKQAQTLNGLWSTFKDTLSQGLADAITPMIPALKSAMPGAISATGKALQLAGRFIVGTMNAVKWLRREFGFIGPPIRELAGKVGPWVVETFRQMKAAFGDTGDTMNTVKGVLQALMPVIGFIAKAVGQNLRQNLVIVSGVMGHIVVPAIRAMAKTFLDTTYTILNGAAKAFGWVPGLGPKLKHARDQFKTFRDSVNRTLDGIRDENVNVNIRVRQLGGGKYTSSTQFSSANRNVKLMGKGGPARRGEWAVVGEDGPELVHFGSSARVTPTDATKRTLAGGSTGTAGPGVTIVLQAQVVGSRTEVVRWVMEGAREAQRAGLLPKGTVGSAA